MFRIDRKDITVEYRDGKKVVYMSPSATSGKSSLDDYRQLRAVADEIGADVRDPYNKITPGLTAEKRVSEVIINITKPRVDIVPENNIDYIYSKYRNLQGTSYYQSSIDDELRHMSARRKYESQRRRTNDQAYQELSEVNGAISDLTRR